MLREKIQSEKLFIQQLPKLSADFIALAREQDWITTQLAEQMTSANRATIRTHLIKLVKDGRLVQHGAGRGAWYTSATSQK